MTSPETNLPPLRASAVTLVDTFVPRVDGRTAQLIRDVLLIAAGAAMTAVAAQVSFTVSDNPVPYTLQTAAVLVTGTALVLPAHTPTPHLRRAPKSRTPFCRPVRATIRLSPL